VHYLIAGVREAVFVNLVIVVGLIRVARLFVFPHFSKMVRYRWQYHIGIALGAERGHAAPSKHLSFCSCKVFSVVRRPKLLAVPSFCALCFITDCFLFSLVSSVRISIQCYAMQLR